MDNGKKRNEYADSKKRQFDYDIENFDAEGVSGGRCDYDAADSESFAADFTDNEELTERRGKTDDGNAPDYGDNFNSQTGEYEDDGGNDDGDDEDDGYGDLYSNADRQYFESGSSDRRKSSGKSKKGKKQKRSKKGKKKSRGKTAAVVLAVIAVLCLVVAVVFALSQYSDENGDNKKASSAATATAEPTEEQYETGEDPLYTEPETEEILTEAPTEPATEAPAPTEAPVPTEAPETEAPAQTEAPAESATDSGIPEEEMPEVEEIF